MRWSQQETFQQPLKQFETSGAFDWPCVSVNSSKFKKFLYDHGALWCTLCACVKTGFLLESHCSHYYCCSAPGASKSGHHNVGSCCFLLLGIEGVLVLSTFGQLPAPSHVLVEKRSWSPLGGSRAHSRGRQEAWDAVLQASNVFLGLGGINTPSANSAS